MKTRRKGEIDYRVLDSLTSAPSAAVLLPVRQANQIQLQDQAIYDANREAAAPDDEDPFLSPSPKSKHQHLRFTKALKEKTSKALEDWIEGPIPSMRKELDDMADRFISETTLPWSTLLKRLEVAKLIKALDLSTLHSSTNIVTTSFPVGRPSLGGGSKKELQKKVSLRLNQESGSRTAEAKAQRTREEQTRETEQKVIDDATKLQQNLSALIAHQGQLQSPLDNQLAQTTYTSLCAAQLVLHGLSVLKEEGMQLADELEVMSEQLKTKWVANQEWIKPDVITAAPIAGKKRGSFKDPDTLERKDMALNRAIKKLKHLGDEYVSITDSYLRSVKFVQRKGACVAEEGIVTKEGAEVALSVLVRYQEQRRRERLSSDPSVYNKPSVYIAVGQPSYGKLSTYVLGSNVDDFTAEAVEGIIYGYYKSNAVDRKMNKREAAKEGGSEESAASDDDSDSDR